MKICARGGGVRSADNLVAEEASEKIEEVTATPRTRRTGRQKDTGNGTSGYGGLKYITRNEVKYRTREKRNNDGTHMKP